MQFEPEKAIAAFARYPHTKFPIDKQTYLKASFKRRIINGLPHWFIVVRAIDKRNGQWFLGAASPWRFSSSRISCIRAAVFGLLNESG